MRTDRGFFFKEEEQGERPWCTLKPIVGPSTARPSYFLQATWHNNNGSNADGCEPAPASGGAGHRAEDGGAAAVVGALAERPTLLPHPWVPGSGSQRATGCGTKARS
jgi:hypothetical protein